MELKKIKLDSHRAVATVSVSQLNLHLLPFYNSPGSAEKAQNKAKAASHTAKLSINQRTRPVCLWSIPVCLICRSELQRVSPSDKLTFLRELRRSFAVLSNRLQLAFRLPAAVEPT